MSEEREKVRCRHCELVQWRVGENCRRCGLALPQPIIKIVERVVEKFVVRHDPQPLKNLEQARQLIADGDGACDDPGRVPEIESQAARGGPAARNRKNDGLP